ncbi:J domain-containing protein, partial [Salmonella enterica subsp. enterica serovar Infantis]
MNICWEILGIEPTTDLECIRQAYLALLPSFHPESDPQGFKRLRQAYEEAQHWAASPAEDANTEEVGDAHGRLVAVRELLAAGRARCRPAAGERVSPPGQE